MNRESEYELAVNGNTSNSLSVGTRRQLRRLHHPSCRLGGVVLKKEETRRLRGLPAS